MWDAWTKHARDQRIGCVSAWMHVGDMWMHICVFIIREVVSVCVCVCVRGNKTADRQRPTQPAGSRTAGRDRHSQEGTRQRPTQPASDDNGWDAHADAHRRHLRDATNEVADRVAHRVPRVGAPVVLGVRQHGLQIRAVEAWRGRRGSGLRRARVWTFTHTHTRARATRTHAPTKPEFRGLPASVGHDALGLHGPEHGAAVVVLHVNPTRAHGRVRACASSEGQDRGESVCVWQGQGDDNAWMGEAMERRTTGEGKGEMGGWRTAHHTLPPRLQWRRWGR